MAALLVPLYILLSVTSLRETVDCAPAVRPKSISSPFSSRVSSSASGPVEGEEEENLSTSAKDITENDDDENEGKHYYIEGGDKFDYPDDFSDDGNFTDEDVEFLLGYIQDDIDEFEKAKKKIAHLEAHLRKHADIHIIDDKDLQETDKTLKEMDLKMLQPFEDRLKAIRSQIKKVDHKFDSESLETMFTVVDNAEEFLLVAKENLKTVEDVEQEWEVMEESHQIQDMLDKDERQSYKGIIVESLLPNQSMASPELKTKLTGGDSVKSNITYPTRLPGRPLNLNKSSSDPKIQTRKNLQKTDNAAIQKEAASNYVERIKTQAIQEVKQKLDEETRDDVHEEVEYEKEIDIIQLSPKVKEAFNDAADISHKFLDGKLHHHEDKQDQDQKPAATDRYLALALCVLALVVLCTAVYVFHKTSLRQRNNGDRVEYQAAGDSAQCQQGYLELDEVRGDTGWNNPWTSFRTPSRKNLKRK